LGKATRVKLRAADLAVMGGTPEFAEPLYVGRPNVGDTARLFARLQGALDRNWLTNGGPLVREFERRVAERAGVRHCVATCNGTAALQLVARATGMRGDVVVPALTFPATPHALEWLGLRPVFCDVDPRTGNADAAAVAAAITPRTTAILAVHLWGRPCAADELEALADRHGLTLVFDAAQAFGATYLGRPVGGFGAAEVFSFHATKVVNAFEGGCVVTDDADLAERLRAMCNFGMNGSREVLGPGTNAKMSEAAAAMGLTSLEAYDASVAHNLANHRRYARELAGLDSVRLLRFDERQRNNYHYEIVAVDPSGGLSRDTLAEVLTAENVIVQKYFSPGCHRLPPYRDRAAVSLPHTDALAARVLALPTGPSVSLEDVRRICDLIRFAVAHAPILANRAEAYLAG
jgi:dTDP-4-amino-4,6-dideoxyglucose